MAILSFGVLQCLRKVVVTMMRIGYEHVDRLITYPYLHNLSANAQPIRMSERHRGKVTYVPALRGPRRLPPSRSSG